MIYSFLILPNLLMELKDLIENLNFNQKNNSKDIISNLENVLSNSNNMDKDYMDDFNFDQTNVINSLFVNSIANLSTFPLMENNLFENENKSLNYLSDENFLDIFELEQDRSHSDFFNFLILKLAYSCKFWIYVFFLHHFKFFFSMNKKKNKPFCSQIEV
jgi:hypothetical protein